MITNEIEKIGHSQKKMSEINKEDQKDFTSTIILSKQALNAILDKKSHIFSFIHADFSFEPEEKYTKSRSEVEEEEENIKEEENDGKRRIQELDKVQRKE